VWRASPKLAESQRVKAYVCGPARRRIDVDRHYVVTQRDEPAGGFLPGGRDDGDGSPLVDKHRKGSGEGEIERRSAGPGWNPSCAPPSPSLGPLGWAEGPAAAGDSRHPAAGDSRHPAAGDSRHPAAGRN
jgi:hypothetical protein